MLFLEFDKESKANKQATKPEVAGEEDILFQCASDDDVSHTFTMTQIMRKLLQQKMILSLDLFQIRMTTNLTLQQTLQYLHPHVINYCQECSNLNPEVHLAVNQFIEHLILTRRDHTPENKKNIQRISSRSSGRREKIFFQKGAFFTREHLGDC
jgi:hypothetical protein